MNDAALFKRCITFFPRNRIIGVVSDLYQFALQHVENTGPCCMLVHPDNCTWGNGNASYAKRPPLQCFEIFTQADGAEDFRRFDSTCFCRTFDAEFLGNRRLLIGDHRFVLSEATV